MKHAIVRSCIVVLFSLLSGFAQQSQQAAPVPMLKNESAPKPSSGDGKADYLLTSDSLWDLFPQQNRCWLGYCLLNSSGRLTGECIAASLQGACCIKYHPAQCPPGRKERAPSNFSCQIRQVARVDAARRCTAH
jgi:hypothetical protein